MPDAIKIVVVSLGLLFFFAHIALGVFKLRYYSSRASRLEAAGSIVPGFAGLLAALAAILPPAYWWLATALFALAVVTLIFGRAAYELAVFHRKAKP